VERFKKSARTQKFGNKARLNETEERGCVELNGDARMRSKFFREGISRDVNRRDWKCRDSRLSLGVDSISGFELFKNSSEARQCLMIFFSFKETMSEGVSCRI
jgi:hypothetical protein